MKERINITNYEAWMLDFVEGRLSDEELAEFHAFLDKHPELRSELEMFDADVVLPKENIQFENKLSLKQNDPLPPVNRENYEDYLVRYVEGLLSKEDQASLLAFVENHPEHKRDLDLYRKTILPQETIVYPDKSKLKKKDPKVIPIGRWVSVASAVAAAVTLLILFSPWEPNQSTVSSGQTEVAEEDPVQPPKTKEDPQTEEPEPVIAPDKTERLAHEEPKGLDEQGSPYLADRGTVPDTPATSTERLIMTKVEQPRAELALTPTNAMFKDDKDTTLWLKIPGVAQGGLEQENIAENQTPPSNQNEDFMTGKEFLRNTLLAGVESVTGKPTSLEKKEADQYVATTFSVGGFEFSRTKKK